MYKHSINALKTLQIINLSDHSYFLRIKCCPAQSYFVGIMSGSTLDIELIYVLFDEPSVAWITHKGITRSFLESPSQGHV